MLEGFRHFLAAGWAFALLGSANAQGVKPQPNYPLAEGSAFVVSVPAGWKDEVRRGDVAAFATVAFGPVSGPRFEVLVSPIRRQTPGPSSPDEIRRSVQAAADGAKAQAVEKSIPVVEMKGPSTHGYYFSATDRAPKPGEYKHLTQGTLLLGGIRIAFTILTNDGQQAVSDAALEMLRNARLTKAQPAGPTAHGAGVPPPPDREKLRALFDAGDFARLDAELSMYLEAYHRGAIGDEALAKPIIALTRDDPDLRPAYDKWIAQKPDSYMARVARGYYLMGLGYLARGTAYAGKTAQAQFEDMRRYFSAATEDFLASLKLDPKPVLGCGTLIAIAKGVGAQEIAVRLLDDAVALDPRVYTARASYFASLRPEWGGSLEQMQAALAAWKNVLTESQLRGLERMLEDSRWRATLAPAAVLVNQKQYQDAIKIYDKALASAPVARAFAMRGYSYAQLGQHDKAIEDYTRALELDPDGDCCSGTRSNRGRSYIRIGAVDKALADYLLAAENEDAFAMRELAVMYAFGEHGFKRDYGEAKRWCERSAKQGDGLSMYCLGSLYHAGLGVPKDPKQAARWFDGAARRGIADAQTDLAIMLWSGQGVPQNRDQAIKWWRAAAKKNNARAKGQLESNVTGWEYFSKVTWPDWLDDTKARRPLLRYLLEWIEPSA